MSNRFGFHGILLAVGGALLLAACSGSTAAPTSPAPSGTGSRASAPVAQDPPAASADAGGGGDIASPACALVTNDEVATAVGYSIATATGAGGTCIYQNADPSQYFAVQLFDSQDAMALYLNIESSAQHVAGLGDDAFWSGTGGFLFVRAGTRAILLLNQAWVFTPDTDTAHLASLVTLAHAALPNL